MVNQLSEISNSNEVNVVEQINILSKLQEYLVSIFSEVSSFSKKVLYKLRRILYSIPFIKSLADQAYDNKVARYRESLPTLNMEDRAILETLQKTGTFSIPIEDLQLNSTEGFLKSTANLVEELKNRPSKDKQLIDLETDKYSDCPEIFFWGIEQRLLNIIEHYIGLPIHLHGYSMRRDIVSNTNGSNNIRSWHLDAEDRTVIKIIVYLNDVGVDGGHYEYIPKDLTKKAAQKLDYYLGYLDDETINNVIPKEHWHNCMGKSGTVIITNTSHVFHRAKPPKNRDRFSISFCYTSNKPTYHWSSEKIFPKNLSELSNQLNDKQRQALVNKNKLFGIKL